MTLQMLAGPIVGAVIGYFTNYIVVKMLFFPKKEIRLFGKRLPFTPGAIPKGKERLAGAIGNVVATKLVTKADILEILLGEELEDQIIHQLNLWLAKNIHTDLYAMTKSEDQIDQLREQLTQYITKEVMGAIDQLEIGEVIAKEAKEAIKEKTGGKMFAMFISDSLIDSITEPIAQKAQNIVMEKGADYIRPQVEKKIVEWENISILEALESAGIGKEKLEEVLRATYEKAVKAAMEKFGSKFDLRSIIEEKINAMDVNELESLVLTVMKKELDVIVNLGAVIGLVLGMINLLI